jgi:hypothetical protein
MSAVGVCSFDLKKSYGQKAAFVMALMAIAEMFPRCVPAATDSWLPALIG